MILLLIVRRSLRQHMFSTLATAFSIALATGLLISVWVVKEQSQRAFTEVSSGFDAVLGARGSKLQLVLNAIFHLEASPGNILDTDYENIKRHPAVKRAIPIAVGDNLRGWRIVGTVPEFFTSIAPSSARSSPIQSGRLFDPSQREAVLGNFVARKLGMKVGDTFHPFHGLIYDEKNQHAETYIVVGILSPTNTPIDKVIWIPLEGVQTMTGHDPKAASDLSAVLIQLRSPAAGFLLDVIYNRQGSRLTFAFPLSAIMSDLFSKIGWFDRVLELIAYLVAIVSAVGVLAAIYNSMSSRQRDIAILRALGAGRLRICAAVLLEAAAIGAIGMIAAVGVYFAIMWIVASIIQEQTGVFLAPWTYHSVMLWAPLGMVTLCSLCGLAPAWKAYRTDVAANLSPLS